MTDTTSTMREMTSTPGGLHHSQPAKHVEHSRYVALDLDDPHAAALEDNPNVAEKPSAQTLLAVAFLILSFTGPLACTFVLPAAILVQIGTSLGDVTNVTWIVGGWSISSSVAFCVAGRLSDIFGRRWTIMSGQFVNLIGCIVAATAHSTLTVVAGATIAGWGTGVVFVAYAGISELLPNKWRGLALGLTEVAAIVPWAAASVLIGTLLNTRTAAGWRWIYYIGIIYNVISLAGTAIFYFPPSRPLHDHDKSRWQQIKEVDYVGIALYSGGLTAFLTGLTWGGTPGHPWSSASVIVPIVVGFCALCACFMYDFYFADQPLFPWSLFRQFREFTLLLVVIFVAGMVYISMSALLPQASLYIFTSDQVEIGIMSLPNGIGLLIFGGICTAFSSKIGHLRLQVVFYLTIWVLFVALYSVAVPNHRGMWMAFQFFGNGPFAAVTVLCYFIAGLNIPLRYLGVASGLIGTFRTAGGSVGNSIFTSILHNIVTERLGMEIAQAGLANGLPPSSVSSLVPATINNALGIPGSFVNVTGITPAIESAAATAFRDVYAFAFKRVFWAATPFGVVAVVASCFLMDPSRYLTNHTAVHIERHTFGCGMVSASADEGHGESGKV